MSNTISIVHYVGALSTGNTIKGKVLLGNFEILSLAALTNDKQ